VATEIVSGLARLGHRIDCFLPGVEREVSPRLAAEPNVTFVWGTSAWRWNRWYSRTTITAFASGLIARGFASMRQRHAVARRHRQEPYDIVYQFSNVESLSVPSRITRSVPLVIHPETHMAGELRHLIAERSLSLRSQPLYMLAVTATIMAVRSIMQRAWVRRARLLICISRVFRDHLVRDYGFPAEATVVIANPVGLERFAGLERAPSDPPTVLVLGRVSVRKGVDDVVAVARELRDRGVYARVRVVGGPSLWSDYTKLLEDLPPESAEYVGPIPADEVPGELARATVLLAPSKYEPFALTVAEALAAGVPVVATSEVGAIEGVDRSVGIEVAPGDVSGMVSSLTAMLERVRSEGQLLDSRARSEAERLFAPDVICEQISTVLEGLVRSNAATPGALAD
jgi:glycosyltransferase involved in cell wall biosynthesis